MRKTSVPLNQHVGHIFTIQIQALEAFREGSGPDHDVSNEREQPITLNLFAPEPRAIKLLGHWFSKREIRQRVGKRNVGPGVNFAKGSKPSSGVILSAPKGSPGGGSFLVVSGTTVPPLGETPRSQLTFAGGFDRWDVVNDRTRSTTFLFLAYPQTDPQALKAVIGSIDLQEA
jgi:hypothetical protein